MLYNFSKTVFYISYNISAPNILLILRCSNLVVVLGFIILVQIKILSNMQIVPWCCTRAKMKKKDVKMTTMMNKMVSLFLMVISVMMKVMVRKMLWSMMVLRINSQR